MSSVRQEAAAAKAERRRGAHGRRLRAGDPPLYINRELSALDFSQRVLELVEDERLPLLERVRFAAIFGTNLDELFMVRVAGLYDQLEAGAEDIGPDGLTTHETLARIRARTEELSGRLSACFERRLRPALREKGIDITTCDRLQPSHAEEVQRRFPHQIFPVLTPLAVGPGRPFPYISNLSLSLAVLVSDPLVGETAFARVKVPRDALPRFVAVGDGATLVPLEDVIARNLDALFPGMEILAHGLFRVTRDADFTIADEADDLLSAVESELRRRRFGEVVRVEVERGMHPALRAQIEEALGLSEDEVYEADGLLDVSDLTQVAELAGFKQLREPSWAPVTPIALQDGGEDQLPDVLAVMRKRDFLVHHPYDSFAASVERFVDQAVHDPNVLAIKQTVYRTSDDSTVVPGLMEAAERGKQAVCLVELKARFDERANINWARELEQVGVHVTYGLPGLKTHAKAILVVRREADGVRRYVHIGTGNYNTRSARLYSDIGFLTTDEEIGADIADLFNYLTGFARPRRYKKISVAPAQLREDVLAEIQATIEAHDADHPARIRMKMNALVDQACIDALYRASQAGVRVELNVRGICCLRPGVAAVSDNIRVVSVVGRFLEHSRIFAFERRGETTVYIGSADLMPRNLDYRVELVAPVEEPALRAELIDVLDRCFADTKNAWELANDGAWRRRDGEYPPRDVFRELMASRSAPPGGRPSLVEAARTLAQEAHAGQVRELDGSGFAEHLVAVARIVSEAGLGDEVTAAAFLHDAVEKGGLDIESIASRFGERVAELVEAVTEDPTIEDYGERKRALRRKALGASREAAGLFAADKLANARALRAAIARDGEKAIDRRLSTPVRARIEHYERTLARLKKERPDLPFLGQLADELKRLGALRGAR